MAELNMAGERWRIGNYDIHIFLRSLGERVLAIGVSGFWPVTEWRRWKQVEIYRNYVAVPDWEVNSDDYLVSWR